MGDLPTGLGLFDQALPTHVQGAELFRRSLTVQNGLGPEAASAAPYATIAAVPLRDLSFRRSSLYPMMFRTESVGAYFDGYELMRDRAPAAGRRRAQMPARTVSSRRARTHSIGRDCRAGRSGRWRRRWCKRPPGEPTLRLEGTVRNAA